MQRREGIPLQFLKLSYWPVWIALGFLRLIAILPHGLRQPLGRALGRLLLKQNSKRVEIVKLNLEWAFPELSAQKREKLAQEFYAYSGQMLIDYGFCWWSSATRFKQAVKIEGLEPIKALMAQGERVILVTGHALALDVGGVAISQQLPLVTYANKMRNPLIQWMMERGRCRFDVELLQRESGMRPLIRALKNGRLLYYVIDEDMPEHSVFASYFGVAKATLTAPARVAKMTGAKVAPCFTFFDRQRGVYVVRIGQVMEGFPSGEDVVDAQAVNEKLERDIRCAPSQYMWTQRLYKTRPDGTPPPYRMVGNSGSGPRSRPETDH
ncbi:MAG: lysophospholipid acyltransferase family protein [Chromatiales bacterium]|nr:lysophospholipid acyltransferase family protein [Chromatiales bacterium]